MADGHVTQDRAAEIRASLPMLNAAVVEAARDWYAARMTLLGRRINRHEDMLLIEAIENYDLALQEAVDLEVERRTRS